MRYTQFTAARADTGAPLPYAVVTVYLAGTTTPASLFTESGAPLSNPFSASAIGLAGFGTIDGTYDIQVASADGTYSTPLIESVQIVDLVNIRGAITSGRLSYATWTELAAKVGTADQIADVPATDTGTHTDPVAGGTVPNSGVFRWSVSPAGWRRIYNSLDAAVAASATAAAGSATAAAGSATAAAGSATAAAGSAAATAGRISPILAYLGAMEERLATADRTPLMVERWSTGGMESRTPANLRTGLAATTMTGGGFLEELSLAVTGTAGALTLTSPDAAKVAGLGADPWGATILASTGEYYDVTVRSNNGTDTLTLWEPLPATLLSGSTIGPTHGDVSNGQHRTQRGNRAEAYKLSILDRRYAQRLDVTGGVNRTNFTGQTLITKNAQLLAGTFSENGISSFLGADSPLNIMTTTSPTRPARPISPTGGVAAGVRNAGDGLVSAFTLPTGSGFFEFYPCIRQGTVAPTDPTGNVTVWITDINGVERQELTTSFTWFVRKIRVLFGLNDVSARWSVTKTDAGVAWQLCILEWRVFRAPQTGRIFPKGSRIIIFMDSWGAYHNGAFAAELAARLPDCVVINHSLGGMTANYFHSWLKVRVFDEAATHVVMNTAINDLNVQPGTYLDPTGAALPLSMGTDTATRTAALNAKLLQMWGECATRGVQPVYLMPSGTGSSGQNQSMANLSSEMFALNYP